MPAKLEKAIIKTLVYADIFDYPLTIEEIGKYLIKIKSTSKNSTPNKYGSGLLRTVLRSSTGAKLIKYKDGFYYLKGKSYIVDIRREREKWSKDKLKIARKIAAIIRVIPTIKLIGVTGTLAVNNSTEDDDIDLMIVTRAKTLWLTRFLVTLLVELIGNRRRPDDVQTNNKICLNMFLDEDHLSIPKKERDLFSAHEVVQMRPIWDRDDTYNKFLRANEWVREYLPNAIRIMNYELGIRNNKKIMILPFYFLEKLLKHFQLWYMKKRRTSEVISDGIIRFHPQDSRVWVMRRYKQKVSFYFTTRWY